MFVPNEINLLPVKCDSSRGKYIVGTSYHNNHKKFAANLSINGKTTHIGLFNTELEAFYAYKAAKEAYIKEVANRWKGKIDPRAYDALMNYQVEITD